MIIKVGGLEPMGPIGVYAYGSRARRGRKLPTRDAGNVISGMPVDPAAVRLTSTSLPITAKYRSSRRCFDHFTVL